jgi:hypothetical protein
MKIGKQAGFALAVVVACVAGWNVSRPFADRIASRTVADDAQESIVSAPRRLDVRLATIPKRGDAPRPFALTPEVVQQAMRDGVLQVALPDGTSFPVRMERESRDAEGHWTVVGRVRTRRGVVQPMILTFGGRAVYGLLPLPDGTSMHITTTGDVVRIGEAGTMLPPGKTVKTVDPDFLLPPSAPVAPVHLADATTDASRTGASHARGPAADAPISIAPNLAPTRAAASAPQDTTPVQVDVLALYTPDLVTLRGSDANARTEITNLYAIASQAHIDSGSRIRLQLADMRQVDIDSAKSNLEVLQDITNNAGPNIGAMRDAAGADLVAVVRPFYDHNRSCGIAWLGASGQNALSFPAWFGFAVVNVDPCNPNVLAHELGHSMGAAHDRYTQTIDGELQFGAFPFSFGYSPPTFTTIMGYPAGGFWINYFSNPRSTICGAPCGVEDIADNVRSFNLVAPAIAAFRGPAGTVTIGDGEAPEPFAGARRMLGIPIRLAAPGPAGGRTFRIDVAGGTATPGADYNLPSATATLGEGEQETWFWVELLGDDTVEPDETILLHISDSSGLPVSDADAVITMRNDDPNIFIDGRVRFGPEVTAPTAPFDIAAVGVSGNAYESTAVRVSPPDFAYHIPFQPGAFVKLHAPDLPAHQYALPIILNGLTGARPADLIVTRSLLVSGKVRAPDGLALPSMVPLHFLEVVGNKKRFDDNIQVGPPDYAFSRYVAPGANVLLEVDPAVQGPGNPLPFEVYRMSFQRVMADVPFDVRLSTLPVLHAWTYSAEEDPVQTNPDVAQVVLSLSARAPAGGVPVTVHTVDGTAKAGQDYESYAQTVLIEEGQKGLVLYLPLIGDNTRERPEYFDLVIDSAPGASVIRAQTRVWIRDNDLRTGGRQQMQ